MEIQKTFTRSHQRVAFIKCNFIERLLVDMKIRQGKSPNIYSARNIPGPHGTGKRYDYIVLSKVHCLRRMKLEDPPVTGPQKFGIQPAEGPTLDCDTDHIKQARFAIESQLQFPTNALLKNKDHGFAIKIEVQLEVHLTLREKAKLQRIYEDAGWTMAFFEPGKFALVYVETKYADGTCTVS